MGEEGEGGKFPEEICINKCFWCSNNLSYHVTSVKGHLTCNLAKQNVQNLFLQQVKSAGTRNGGQQCNRFVQQPEDCICFPDTIFKKQLNSFLSRMALNVTLLRYTSVHQSKEQVRISHL